MTSSLSRGRCCNFCKPSNCHPGLEQAEPFQTMEASEESQGCICYTGCLQVQLLEAFETSEVSHCLVREIGESIK